VTTAPELPIVYIRGYAGGTAGIENQVEDPLYGFNKGTVHVRVGGDGSPMYYQFEGPLLRLIGEHGYQLLVHGDQAQLLATGDEQLPAKTIWVHRFYDVAAPTITGTPPAHPLWHRLSHFVHDRVTADQFHLEDAARSLYALVEQVLARTGAPKVVLIAHSMGGLVARCMMQKICAENDEQGNARRPAKEIVSALFTYGTPHGGIALDPGLVNRMMEQFGPAGSDVFAPRKMYGYLTPGADFGDVPPDGLQPPWDPQLMPADVFDTDDVFCIVGTDPKDYGLSRIPVGPRSDGLVRIEHAYVRGAHRSFVYKSHSGTYGEVNSEEGYQNLQRFLFGRWAVAVAFADLPTAFVPEPGDVWQADMQLAIRGLSVVISEQRAEHWCPIELNGELAKRGDDPNHPVPLVRTFLLDNSDSDHKVSRYVLTLSVSRLRTADHGFDFANHLEKVPEWSDSLVVDIGPDEATGRPLAAWAGWASKLPGALADHPRMPDPLFGPGAAPAADGTLTAKLALPPEARTLPIFGDAPTLQVGVRDRWAGAGA
jgi:pimeloyl-ACP methyl ester carboxylesterase